MPNNNHTKDRQMRLRIAMEAARILAEGGSDYQSAKRKAAASLGAPDTRNLPSNVEIEQALIEHQRLFYGDTQPARLRELRLEAVKAMEFFQDFDPKLVGPVLNGTAGEHSDVQLHLFAGTQEDVALYLMERGVPYDQSERRLRFGRDRYEVLPVYRFVAGDIDLDLTVFPLDRLRQAPCSPVDGRPMRRGNLGQVQALLAKSDPVDLDQSDFG